MGPKTSMAALLLVGAVPFFFMSLVRGFAGLIAIRSVPSVRPFVHLFDPRVHPDDTERERWA